MPLEYRQCVGLAYVIKNRIHHLRRKVGGTKTKRLPMSERIYALIGFTRESVSMPNPHAFAVNP